MDYGCAQRLRVQWQQSPPFDQAPAIIGLHHDHEKAMSTLTPFPYGARSEGGGWFHRSLRRPSPQCGLILYPK
jgi:hypothetical protein